MDKLDAWDASKADDPQYMMNMAKKYVIMDTLTSNGGKCTFGTLFEKAEELHCDVLTAALGSMKRKKVVGYASEMPLLHPKDDAGEPSFQHARAPMLEQSRDAVTGPHTLARDIVHAQLRSSFSNRTLTVLRKHCC